MNSNSEGITYITDIIHRLIALCDIYPGSHINILNCCRATENFSGDTVSTRLGR
ncbi:hypothetical protein ANCCAN_07119 [Ancylostoma caninum]|uniref:Uncharacterized protein n=1 Tax=Ancylostoma caninum TaxID=29170 RepID=A0A368GUY3_ANCCA|nr:hypothetical protein ANCCAN_07119 [Ancylostoma caninum]